MKKIISTLTGFILIIAIFVFAFIITSQRFLTVDNVSKILKNVYEKSETYQNDYFIKMVNGSNSKDNYNKYFNNDEIEELYIKYFAEYILYSNGVPNSEQPNFNELKEKVDGYIEKYETETGLEANRESSFKFFYDLDENMARTSFISNKVRKVVQFIFNKKVKNISLAIVLICIVVIIMLNREPTRILMHISSIFISNGIGMVLIKKAIDNYRIKNVTNRFLIDILNELSNRFTILLIISFVIGGIALLAFILIKIFYKRKDAPKIAEITKAALPGYVTDPDNLNYNNRNSQIYPQESLDKFNNMGRK